MEPPKEPEVKIINWKALRNSLSATRFALFIVSGILIYILVIKEHHKEFDGMNQYLVAKGREYDDSLADLSNKIYLTSTKIQKKLGLENLTKLDTLELLSQLEEYKKYEEQLQELSAIKHKVFSQMNANKEPFLTLKNAKGLGEDFVITKNEMRIMMRFIFGMAEQMRDSRFELRTEEIEKNGNKKAFLLDKSLGTTWLLDGNGRRFNKVKIEDLENERRNQESDRMIDMLVDKTSGFSYNMLDTTRHTLKDSIR